MKQAKRKKLEKAGFKVGTVQEFFQLSDEEMAPIDLCVRKAVACPFYTTMPNDRPPEPRSGGC